MCLLCLQATFPPPPMRRAGHLASTARVPGGVLAGLICGPRDQPHLLQTKTRARLNRLSTVRSRVDEGSKTKSSTEKGRRAGRGGKRQGGTMAVPVRREVPTLIVARSPRLRNLGPSWRRSPDVGRRWVCTYKSCRVILQYMHFR